MLDEMRVFGGPLFLVVCAAVVVASSSRLEAAVRSEKTSEQSCVFVASPTGTGLRFLARGGIGEWSPSGASLTLDLVDPNQSEPTVSGTRVVRRNGELVHDFATTVRKGWLGEKRLLVSGARGTTYAVAGLDGSLRVARPPSIRYILDATVASAAKLVVFAGFRNNGDEYKRFEFVNADRQLVGSTRLPRSGEHSVSPDGQWIAATYEASVAGRSTGVHRRNGTSVGLVSIAADGFAWSPDSARLAVVMLATGSDMGATPAEAGVYIHETGRKRSFRRVVRGNVGSVSWSPNGTHVAYMATGGLHTIPAAGGSPVRISRNADRVAWSPDGTRFAYGGGGAIFTVKAAGGRSTRITPADGYGYPRWSPNGKLIAFERARNIYPSAPACPID